jgi:exodeoxyribonuclease V alpha subunit
VLRKSYRFGAESGIGEVARALNRGDGEAAVRVLNDPARADAAMMPVTEQQLREFLRRWLVPRISACLAAGEPGAILRAMSRFRVLCPLRAGRFGVSGINRLCESLLAQAGVIEVGGGAQYAGRPIMVTGNDDVLGLFNGDIGVLWQAPDGESGVRAYFETSGGPRRVLVSRLPVHETVYAMTVHKAQGSEFDEVLLILPDAQSRVLTRELLYTGITRARRRVTLLGHARRVREAAERPVVRTSGLYDALWNDPAAVSVSARVGPLPTRQVPGGAPPQTDES